MVRRYIPKSTQELADWYMRYVSPLSLVAGFILDTLFLAKRVDLFLTNAVLFTYLVVAAIAILLINLIQTGRIKLKFAITALPLLPVVVQFAFGGLFSAYLSLYSRSAEVATAWIFVIAVAVLVLANERFSHFYARFSVQMPIYFTVLFSFLIFFLPVVFRAIGPLMFIASGAISLLIMVGFWHLLASLVPEVARENRRTVTIAIAAIFVGFNVLYFTNAIPPLPLALKGAGTAHAISHDATYTYRILVEDRPWYERYLDFSPTFHRVPGEPVYVWSAIFAPSGLRTRVLHEWQRYDGESRSWVTETAVWFAISGGRDGGYRGYSQKSTVEPGKWRVNVLTQYGQLIGRVHFTVEDVEIAPPLVEITP
ncbi:DUF2914 domain-containing protein [Candidatus Parcubacteria bacterium]|nr:MAG: DUF2914 domain-containing protein [Candidatus Parcubacteria bacterium]